MDTLKQAVSRLVLASASPYRKQLLDAAGVEVTTRVAPIDERSVTAETPAALAQARARAKALAVAGMTETRPGELVIGCDQVLELDGESFDKVDTPDAAASRLTRLAGKTHYLQSAYCLVITASDGSGAVVLERLVPSPMPMRRLTATEIEAYVALGEWKGSVGCYQFENRGVHLFEGAVADQGAIVGLPVQELLKDLRSLGINTLLAPQGPWAGSGPAFS